MNTHTAVREKYGSIATDVATTGTAACCSPQLRCCDPITKNLYTADEQGSLPEKAVLASLGCGNPTALIDLRPGETVLDLGSGGGIDVLLSARRVGPAGKAYGLDMTDEMLEPRPRKPAPGRHHERRVPQRPDRAHSPRRQLRRRHHLQLRHQSLARQGSRARRGDSASFVPAAASPSPTSSCSAKSPMQFARACCSGSAASPARSEQSDYQRKLEAAGFTDISFEITRTYDIEDARQFLTEAGVDVDAIAPQVEGKFVSAFVRATKPQSCCGPDGCACRTRP